MKAVPVEVSPFIPQVCGLIEPSPTQFEKLRRVRAEFAVIMDDLDAITGDAVRSLNRSLEQHVIVPVLRLPTRLRHRLKDAPKFRTASPAGRARSRI